MDDQGLIQGEAYETHSIENSLIRRWESQPILWYMRHQQAVDLSAAKDTGIVDWRIALL